MAATPPQPSPMDRNVRWVFGSVRARLARFGWGGLLLTVLAGAATLLVSRNPLIAGVVAVVAVVLVALLWTVLLAPYQQRDALRKTVLGHEVTIRDLTSEAARQASPLYRSHVEDLHRFAAGANNFVYFQARYGRTENYAPIPITGRDGLNFRAHFPETGKLVDAWNDIARQYEPTNKRLDQRVRELTIEVVGDPDSAVRGFLMRVAAGNLRFDAVELQLVGGSLQAIVPDGPPLGLGGVPAGPVGRVQLELVRQAASGLSEDPDVQAFRDCVQKLSDMRDPLDHELGAVQLKHQLPGHCDDCPGPTK